MTADLLMVIGRVRRSTRSPDIILICDELEKRLVTVMSDGTVKAKFDKVAYQREYMKKWRAKGK